MNFYRCTFLNNANFHWSKVKKNFFEVGVFKQGDVVKLMLIGFRMFLKFCDAKVLLKKKVLESAFEFAFLNGLSSIPH